MNFATALKGLVFLVILFVMLYVGVNNTENIAFSFPVASAKRIEATAALIYFGVFAVGVFAGMLLVAGGGKKSGGSKSGK